MTKEIQSLYDAVTGDLGRMDSVKIRTQNNFIPRFLKIRRLGEVVIGYETEEKPHLWGLIKSNRPLASLENIREVLAQNPDIGQPVKTGNDYLIYERSFGGSVDKVAVRERPLVIRD